MSGCLSNWKLGYKQNALESLVFYSRKMAIRAQMLSNPFVRRGNAIMDLTDTHLCMGNLERGGARPLGCCWERHEWEERVKKRVDE